MPNLHTLEIFQKIGVLPQCRLGGLADAMIPATPMTYSLAGQTSKAVGNWVYTYGFCLYLADTLALYQNKVLLDLYLEAQGTNNPHVAYS